MSFLGFSPYFTLSKLFKHRRLIKTKIFGQKSSVIIHVNLINLFLLPRKLSFSYPLLSYVPFLSRNPSFFNDRIYIYMGIACPGELTAPEIERIEASSGISRASPRILLTPPQRLTAAMAWWRDFRKFA